MLRRISNRPSFPEWDVMRHTQGRSISRKTQNVDYHEPTGQYLKPMTSIVLCAWRRQFAVAETGERRDAGRKKLLVSGECRSKLHAKPIHYIPSRPMFTWRWDCYNFSL